MTTWNQRLFPYPLLAPWSEDYVGAKFGVDVPQAVLNNGRTITVNLHFHISSETIRDLIGSSKARYAVEVSCPRTFVRSTHEICGEDQVVLNAGEYSEEILITPYVVTTRVIQKFSSSEHALEWSVHRPEGFSVPEAGILAVGNTTRITLEDAVVNSVIDMVANRNIEQGTFAVQLDYEHIKIHVAIADKKRIEAVRRRRGAGVEFKALFPSLYLHAVAEALRHLSEHENTRWAFTVRNALERSGLADLDSDVLRDESLKYAQQLMEQPLGTFLNAALRADDEE